MYQIYEIKDKALINKIISLDDKHLLAPKDYSNIKVEIDAFEESAVINTGELYIKIDYQKALELLI